MKKAFSKCLITAIIIQVFLWANNVLVLDAFAFNNAEKSSLASTIKIDTTEIIGCFSVFSGNISSGQIDSQLILNADAFLRELQENIDTALIRIINSAIDEFNLRDKKVEIPETIEEWFNDESEIVTKRRVSILKYLTYEIIGKKEAIEIEKVCYSVLKEQGSLQKAAKALCGCGTKSFFGFQILKKLGYLKQDEFALIESDHPDVNHIFTGIKIIRDGKTYFRIIDAAVGRELIAAGLGINEARAEISEEILLSKGFRVHYGQEAVRFSLGYIFNNMAVIYNMAFLESGRRKYLDAAESFLKKSLEITPEYAEPKRKLRINIILDRKRGNNESGLKSENNKTEDYLKALNDEQRYFAEKIIARGGKIPFAEFMEYALYSEHGFFTNFVSIGESKHFCTYAESLPFAHSLAKQLIEMWEKMGKPGKFTIVEMGAGRGMLAKNIILYIQQNEPQLFKSLDYVIVEISSKLVVDQTETLIEEFGSVENIPVRWVEGDAFDLSNLRDVEGVFLSNELPDNFPVHRIKKVNGRVMEIYTAFQEGKFVDELGPLSSSELAEYVANLEVELKEGVEVPVNLNLRIWQENIARALKRGFVITIDYGGKIEEISDQMFAVWNRETNAIKNSEEKIKYIYANSGSCDITANVNFFDQARWGKIAGLNVHGYTLQKDFLCNLGFDVIIDELLKQGMQVSRRKSLLADIATNFHFKVLIQSKNVDPEMPLSGLKHIEPFYYLYGQATDLVLPVTPQESSFLVCTNDRINITPKLVAKGKESVKDYLRIFPAYSREFAWIIEPNERNVRDGVYVLQLSRQEIEDMRIYNAQGDILFEGREFFKDKSRKNALAIEYEEYERRYLSLLDLESMDAEVIPDVFYLHRDGSMMTFPQHFRPLDVISSRKVQDEKFIDMTLRAI